MVLMPTLTHSSGAQEVARGREQPALPGSSTSQSTYLVSAAQSQSGNIQPIAAPVRLARVSFLQGDVKWQHSTGPDSFRDDSAQAMNVSDTNQNDAPDADRVAGNAPSWTRLTLNLPVQEATAIQVARNARLELQFDEGSFLRLGSDTQVTLRALHSDKDGAFTEIVLEQGVASLHLRHQYSAFRVVTPRGAIGAVGPAKLRVGVTPSPQQGEHADELPLSTEFAIRAGQATVEARQGDITLEASDYLTLRDKSSPFRVARLPVADEWERWNDTRDRRFTGRLRPAARHLPSNIALVAGDLDLYGRWRQDARHGYVWCPRVAAGWRPYSAGRWANVRPWGWTWVSTEPWGWAPYHYGTWTSTQWGWSWVPGPSKQPWCPAVVSLSQSNGSITWVPLSPDEVHYPTTLSSGFNRWDTYFSVPLVAAYCPAPSEFYTSFPSYASHYSTSYRTELYIAQPCYSYWGTPVIKTVNIYKGPVTIINKRRGSYPYPGRVKNIFKGPVTIINLPPRGNGKSPGRSAGHSSGKPATKTGAVIPAVPVNVRQGGASSAPAGEFGKSFSHRRATASDVVYLSRKRLSLLGLRPDTSVMSQAVSPTPALLENVKPGPRLEPRTRPVKESTNTAANVADQSRDQSRAEPAENRVKQAQQPHRERAEAKRADPGSSADREREREQPGQEGREQEPAARREWKEERRDAQQQEENQRRQQREERERSERQERLDRQERQQRVQQEQQQRERERNERQEREGQEQQRQENERRQQGNQNRRRAEQQDQSPAAPANNDADRTPGNGRRRDR